MEELDEAAAHLVAILTRRGETLATAESLTAGLVCATVARIPGVGTIHNQVVVGAP